MSCLCLPKYNWVCTDLYLSTYLIGFNYYFYSDLYVCSYCLNITFYLALKAKRVPIDGHPVIERIVQYRKVRSYCTIS